MSQRNGDLERHQLIERCNDRTAQLNEARRRIARLEEELAHARRKPRLIKRNWRMRR